MVNKMMIEIDDPEECGRCPFVQEIRADFSAIFENNMTYVPHYICSKIHKEIGNMKAKRTDCPLRPEPERITSDESSYAEGWNTCIDYLEGK